MQDVPDHQSACKSLRFIGHHKLSECQECPYFTTNALKM